MPPRHTAMRNGLLALAALGALAVAGCSSTTGGAARFSGPNDDLRVIEAEGYVGAEDQHYTIAIGQRIVIDEASEVAADDETVLEQLADSEFYGSAVGETTLSGVGDPPACGEEGPMPTITVTVVESVSEVDGLSPGTSTGVPDVDNFCAE